jgi:hypothetical protein
MKKLSTLLLLALSLSAPAQVIMQIDSVVVRPSNPTPTTPVYLHIYGYCNQIATLNTPSVTSASNNHYVDACYTVGMAMVITNIHDSVYLFTGPTGVHNVGWSVGYVYNAPPPCNIGLTQGSQSVNVVSTGIAPTATVIPTRLHWDEVNQSLQINNVKAPVDLLLTDMSGRICFRQHLYTGENEIDASRLADGVYIATLADRNSVMLREKLLITR